MRPRRSQRSRAPLRCLSGPRAVPSRDASSSRPPQAQVKALSSDDSDQAPPTRSCCGNIIRSNHHDGLCQASADAHQTQARRDLV
eukprot:2328246-Rhodomonas_salina.1